jgi:hypothetical protein
MRLRHVIISLVVWAVVLCIAYIITSVRTNHAKARIKDSGIETIHALSKLVSLPLLDSNAQTINAMLVYAARETPIAHAAVLDHQEEIVTFAGAEKVIPAPNPDEHPGKDTAFWEGELPDHKKIFGFASDVTYSGTTIGRIQIALPAQELVTIKNQFLIVAVLACVILLLVIISFRYYPGIWATPTRLTNVYRRDTVSDPALESSVVTCPLCGARNSFSTKLFKRSNFGRLLIIRASSNTSGPGGDADLKGMRLSDLAKRDELSWLKRQIVLRCAEIIKKLAG